MVRVIVPRRNPAIGEIGLAAAADRQLAARHGGPLQQRDAQAASGRLPRAEQPGRPGPQNEHIRPFARIRSARGPDVAAPGGGI